MTGSRDDLKVELGPGNFHQFKRLVRVEALRGFRGRPEIVKTQLPRVSQHEVIDALLGFEPLVDVLVAGKNDIHSVGPKQRLEESSQVGVRTVGVGV